MSNCRISVFETVALQAKTDSMDVEAAVAVLMKLTVKLFMASKRTIHDLMLVLSSEERLEALDSIGSLIDMSLKNLGMV